MPGVHDLPMALQGLAIDLFRLSLWLALLSALFVPLERLFAVHPARIFRRQVLTDLGHYFVNSLLPAVLLATPVALLAIAAQRLMPAALTSAVSGLPLPTKGLLTLVVGEFGVYWGHRLSHQLPWLWRFHAVHHSAEHLDFLVNTRAHPVDLVFTRLCGLLPLCLLGLANPSAAGSALPVLAMLLGTLWGFFLHANLRWRFGPFERLVSTPAFHHWHHTRHGMIDRNFASMLPVFDRLFGTLHLPRTWPVAYGIDATLPGSLTGQWLAPWHPDKAKR